jgi:hypothetical protein
MNKLKIFLIFIFIINIYSVNSEVITSNNFVGVSFSTSDAVDKDYEEVTKRNSRDLLFILQELSKRFDEAVEVYNTPGIKEQLPSCLVEAMDRWLQDLKIGEKKLRFKWMLDKATWFNVSKQLHAGGGAFSSTIINVYDCYKFQFYYKMTKKGRSFEVLKYML